MRALAAMVCVGGLLAAQPMARAEEPERLEELVVEAKKPVSAASSDEIRAKDFELRPHESVFEIINSVPGLVANQHQGGLKAPQWLIRGFDADHGTDVAVSVDGLPVNLVTHAHGQGYADINFIIPETIERLELRKGPYFTDIGDFGTAGAIDFVSRDQVPESFVYADGGSFATQRYVALLSPPALQSDRVKSLFALQARFEDGPFESPERLAAYNAFAKVSSVLAPGSKLSTTFEGYSGDWHASGQVPLREIGADRLDRFGAIDPLEGGHTDRENLNVRWDYAPTASDSWFAQAYASHYHLSLFTDFTFFRDTGLRFIETADGSIVDTRDGPIVAGAKYVPGDGIDQADRRWLYGGRIRYTHFSEIVGLPLQSQVGIETRNDVANVALYRQVHRKRFFAINDIHLVEDSIAGYTQQQIFLSDWIRLEVGVRGDFYLFHLSNRLPDQGPDPNFTPVLIHGDTTDSIVSPKANLILTPIASTDVYFNFGTGFHSNDARNAVLADQAKSSITPLVRAIGWEVGARTRQFDRLDVATSFWFLDLDSELTFSGDAGNQETGAGGSFQPSGRTRRYGVDFEARYQFTRWLYGDYDLSWAHARFRNGDAVALAPSLLMNGGLSAEFENGLAVALRLRYVDDRPAIEDRSLTARGYLLLDLIGRYRWKSIELDLALKNLTDRDYREAQFADNSCVLREVGTATGCSARPGQQTEHAEDPAGDIHFTPGNPLGAYGGVKVFF